MATALCAKYLRTLAKLPPFLPSQKQAIRGERQRACYRQRPMIKQNKVPNSI